VNACEEHVACCFCLPGIESGAKNDGTGNSCLINSFCLDTKNCGTVLFPYRKPSYSVLVFAGATFICFGIGLIIYSFSRTKPTKDVPKNLLNY
jgi:hypothetical protein